MYNMFKIKRKESINGGHSAVKTLKILNSFGCNSDKSEILLHHVNKY